VNGERDTFTGIEHVGGTTFIYTSHGMYISIQNIDFKLLLRPLDSMTEEEREAVEDIYNETANINWNRFKDYEASAKVADYLRSKRLDVDGLIPSGHAIDINTIKI
jgi:hypothetical protein